MEFMPKDWREGLFAGRIETPAGPTPVLVRKGRLIDVSRAAPTVSELVNSGADLRGIAGKDLGPLESFAFASVWSGATQAATRLLAPIDLQVIKAGGVTFAVSAIERVIEERAMGDAARADEIRAGLVARVGSDIRAVKPGSPQAATLKQALIADGLWSQYLEVAIGPDAEVFTKSAVLSAVGWGDYVGVRSDSTWNNPEPEIVLVCDRSGRIAGVALGNDVNLRDLEGRSALLLGKAKDNNASCALGPFIRLFDDSFTLDDVRSAEIQLEIRGEDGFALEGMSNMSLISRDPADLARQVFSQHAYPDGCVFYCGTMFAPTKDRGQKGHGFTHKIGDVVRISSPRLGTLENKVTTCDKAPKWEYGIIDLMRNLAGRGLLAS